MKNRYTSILIFLALLWPAVNSACFGQAALLERTEPSAWPAMQVEHVDLAAWTGFFEDTTGRLQPEEVLKQPFEEMPVVNWIEKRRPYRPARIWLKFSIDHTTGQDTLRFVFFPGMHASLALFELKNDTVSFQVAGGLFAPRPAFTWQTNTNCLPIEVLPGRRSTYLVSVKNFFNEKMYDQVRTELFSPDAYRSYCRDYKDMQLPFLLYLGFVLGGLSIMVLIGLLQFLQTRGPAYLCYAFFVSASALNFARVTEMYTDIRWISNIFPLFHSYMGMPATTFFYLLFVYYFLDFHLQNNKKSKLIKWAVWFFGAVFVLSALSGIIYVSSGGTSNVIALSFKVYYVLLILPGFLVLYLSSGIQNHLSRFISIGTLLLMGASVVVVILPLFINAKPLHEQGPFENKFGVYGICILLECLCFIFGLGYKTKMLEIQKRLAIEEQERDRLRIARDLHDEVGSTLSSISILSESARSGAQKGLDEARFDNIGDKARAALDSISDIVWSVNPENDSMEKALARMSAYASEMLENVGTELRFEVGEGVSALTLPMEKRKDFYLIFKEAIHNCAKYARAKKVVVAISKEDNTLIMGIKDDGVGFEMEQKASGDLTTFKKLANLGGNGFKNMAARADALGGELEINSIPGNGTLVRLRMNIYTNA